MEIHGGEIALACCKCGMQKALTEDEARFTFTALAKWCCPACRTVQAWPYHLLRDYAPGHVAH